MDDTRRRSTSETAIIENSPHPENFDQKRRLTQVINERLAQDSPLSRIASEGSLIGVSARRRRGGMPSMDGSPVILEQASHEESGSSFPSSHADRPATPQPPKSAEKPKQKAVSRSSSFHQESLKINFAEIFGQIWAHPIVQRLVMFIEDANEFIGTTAVKKRTTINVVLLTVVFVTIIHAVAVQAHNHNSYKNLDSLIEMNQRLIQENHRLRLALGHPHGLPEHQIVSDQYQNLSFFAPIFALSVFAGVGFIFLREFRLARPQVEAGSSTWREFIAYRVDYYFSSTAYAKPALLLGLTFILVVTGAIFFWFAAEEGTTFGSAMWTAWTFVASPGSHSSQQTVHARFVSFMVTLGGMLVFALVIGIVAESIGEKVDSLKKGRSRIIESGHTLILGWSDKTLPIVKEIAEANKSDGGKPIVILADQDKSEMEEKLRSVPLQGSSVIVRSGSPISQNDLRKVSATTARSIVVLSEPGNDADEIDARVVRVVLSVEGLGDRMGHIVVEMCDVDNRELVMLVGNNDVEIMVTHDIIGRLMIQSARQPGLAQVLEGLLGFDGSEFYLKEWPELFGKTFGEILYRFDDAIPLGIKPQGEQTILNPDDDLRYGPGDEILVLAEDDDSYQVNEGRPEGIEGELPANVRLRSGPERMLFCGWRRDMGDMIMELDSSVEKGSMLWILCQVPVSAREGRMEEGGRQGVQGIKNLELVHRAGNPTIRRDLEGLPLETFDSVLILADEEVDMQSADSRSLATLLLVRDIQRERAEESRASHAEQARDSAKKRGSILGRKNSIQSEDEYFIPDLATANGRDALRRALDQSIDGKDECVLISEVLDPRTRALISVAHVSDYVMSNEIISAAIAQVAEQRDVNAVLQELLSAQGNETYVRDARLYADLPAELSFFEMFFRARSRQEIAIGFKLIDDEKATLNPPDKNMKRKWQVGDALVVISEK